MRQYEHAALGVRYEHAALNVQGEHVAPTLCGHVEFVDEHPNDRDDGDPKRVHDDALDGPSDDRSDDDVDNGPIHS